MGSNSAQTQKLRKPGPDNDILFFSSTTMNDAAGQQQREQETMPDFDFGEYITSAANSNTQQHSQLEMFGGFQQRSHSNSQMNLDSSIATQSMLDSHSRMDGLAQGQPQNIITAEMLNLKGRLEQQMKLQQWQQWILQQQLELLNGQPSTNPQQKEAIFHGLLTPGPSAELPAMVPKDLVPPMMLQPEMFIDNNLSATSIVNQLSPHSQAVNPSLSTPTPLAFSTTPPFPLPSPVQSGYDLPPTTSPWMLPTSTVQQQQRGSQQLPLSQAQQRPQLKRAVSSSGEDQGGMRKRTSPNVGSSSTQRRNNGSTPSSATSTPAMRSLAPGSESMQFLSPSSDTPSPVDLSMPPPAPPAHTTEASIHSNIASSSSSVTFSRSASNSVSPDIAPMTPASILNLRKLTTGLMSSTLGLTNTEKKDAGLGATAKRSSRCKSLTGAAGASTATGRGRRGSIARPGVSPSLKPLLPGAVPPTPVSPLAQPSHPAQPPLSGFALPASAGTIQGPRKTSHKAAEQKRRDSLKTSFDELRLLLPPLPLLPEEAGDEPPLPGSMPPRGPPKGDADGPNRGVSKLALLRCGNNYIRELKGKVGRRDKEIDILRDEVRRLRVTLGEEDAAGGLDLERDVDEGVVTCGSGSVCGVEESGVDGDEEGE